MAHKVMFNLPERELGKTDAKFIVHKNGKRLGEITISKGGFEYYPSNAQKPVKLQWSKFHNLMINSK
jgi:hypothetical protein